MAKLTDVATVAVPVTDHGRDTGIRLATTDASGDHAELQAAGVATSELLTWEGVPPMFSFRDPDGNELYVVER